MDLRRIASRVSGNLIDFPEDEHYSLKSRLLRGDPIYTTRILNEKGKYRPSQILDSPFGQLIVEDVQSIDEIKSHPFISELTPEQIEQLRGHVMDLVKLRSL